MIVPEIINEKEIVAGSRNRKAALWGVCQNDIQEEA
jgi:hypothetical protein